ncbi:MAG TPA: crosslink repair DNA glycosylase YcaQ family protein [Allosphingosinicella sp.]|jgi:hypothetical protein
MADSLSLRDARRIALAAQGFGSARPASVGPARMSRITARLGLHQIDSVNVLARAHYLPLFSRLGPYPRDLLDRAAWGKPRRLFEYWGHEASLLPLELQPLLRWRMARADRGEGMWRHIRAFAGERRPAAMAVLKRIEAEGPLAASDLREEQARKGWWEWSDAKTALEWLFWAGHVTTATRRSSFERVYDLPERVIPADILAAPTPDRAEAQRRLIEIGAKAMGVATAADLRDYFRLKPEATPRIDELVEEGALLPVRVEGWRQPAFLHRDAAPARRIGAAALLVPFDPLIWERSRTERLFGLRYRIEIYTPPEKRVHGYYVLPFLCGEGIAARVDLKADRAAGLLRVQAAFAEPGAPADAPERLAAELASMAGWLGLGGIAVARKGDLAPALATQLGRLA